MVESEATFETNIKCTKYDKNYTQKQQLINEMKENDIFESFQDNEEKVEELYHSKRNYPNGPKTPMLQPINIMCARLWTDEKVCPKIKEAHRKGETCKYRYFCTTLMETLQILMKTDDKTANGMNQIKSVYSGIHGVTFDESKSESSFETFLENMQTHNNGFGIDTIKSHLIWDSFTSTTPDVSIAKRFSLDQGIILLIDFADLCNNGSIAFGDISWMSDYDEREILIQPCMIRILPMDRDKYPLCCQNDEGLDVFRAQLKRLEPVSNLMMYLKTQQRTEEKNDGKMSYIPTTQKRIRSNNTASKPNIDVNETKIDSGDNNDDDAKIDIGSLNSEKKRFIIVFGQFYQINAIAILSC